jgi:hypothetical protein
MTKKRRVSAGPQTVSSEALRGAVRRALQLSAAMTAVGATLSLAPDAGAGVFPAEFELAMAS